MMDIISVVPGQDLGLLDTQTERAKNILSVQIGSLEYAPELGIDLKFFLKDEFRFQDDSFKAYLIEVLSRYGINVASLTEVKEMLSNRYIFNLSPDENSTGLIAR